MNDHKVTIWFCRPWESYIASLEAQCEQVEREYDLEQDIETEEQMAIAHAYGEGECPWPWYADDPIEVQRPQVFIPTKGDE